jgi:hypothetical protein
MAHACNPNSLGGRDQEDSSSRPGKKLAIPHLSQFKWVCWYALVIPAIGEA